MTERIEDMPKHEPHGSGMNGNGVGIHIDDAEIRQWIQDPDLIKRFRQLAAEKNEQEAARKPIPKMSAYRVMQTTWELADFIIAEILPIGLSNLGGLPKLGKSWLSLQIALNVATGGAVFNRRCKQGKVWYLALEDYYPRLYKRMRKQGWPMRDVPVDFTGMDGLKAIGDMRHGGTERILEEIDKNKYGLTIIDTLSRIIKGDQKERHEIDPILEPLQIGAQQLGCGILLLDHHRKSVGMTSDISGDSLMDTAGSVAKSGTIDTAWNLYRKRGETIGKLSIIGRDIENPDLVLQVSFDKETCLWSCQGEVQEIQAKTHKQIILEAIGGAGTINLTNLVKATGFASSTVQGILESLSRDGFITRSGYLYSLRDA